MPDLLARLEQRPIHFQRAERLEFDRDLALDALAAVLNCNAGACGNPMLCPTRCKADKEAGTILRELRGATLGEGGGL